MLSHTLLLCVIEPKWWSWKLSKNHRVQPFHFLKINSMEVICIQKNTFNLSVVWVLCILTNMFTVWPPRLYYRTLSSPQKFPVCPFPVNSTHHSGPRDSWFFFFLLFSFLNLLTAPCGMWGLNSPFRDWTHTLCVGSEESQTLGCQESPKATNLFLNRFRVAWSFLKFYIHRTLQHILYFAYFIWHNIWDSFMS